MLKSTHTLEIELQYPSINQGFTIMQERELENDHGPAHERAIQQQMLVLHHEALVTLTIALSFA